MNYLIPSLIAICIGVVIAGICFYLSGITQRIMRRRKAQCIVGCEGLYITGQYWPWASVAQHLEAVQIDEENRLDFTFRSSGNATNITVPIPSGEQLVAAAIVQLLANR